MNLISKLQPIIIILSSIIGLILGNLTPLGNISTMLIEVFLMLLLYILFLSVDLNNLKSSFKNIRYTSATVIINFIITPIIGYIIGLAFFKDIIEIRMGILMLLVTPCTDWYLVFTGLSKGNVELNMSILPLNLILQIILMPVYLIFFLGSEINLNISHMLGSIIFVLAIPFICSIISKFFIKNKIGIQNFLEEQGDNLQLLFLCLAVIVMFATEGESLVNNPMLLLQMIIPLLCFFILIFFIAQIIGRGLKFNKKDIIALNFTTLARNSPLALAIAVATFPTQPLISLVLVVGSLIELPTLSIVAGILLRWRNK